MSELIQQLEYSNALSEQQAALALPLGTMTVFEACARSPIPMPIADATETFDFYWVHTNTATGTTNEDLDNEPDEQLESVKDTDEE